MVNKMYARCGELRVSIGDIVISVAGDNIDSSRIDNAYRAFITESIPEVRLKLHYQRGICQTKSRGERVFDSSGGWSMFKRNGSYVIKTTSGEAVLDSGFQSGDIYLEEEEEQAGLFLSYPMDELLMINLLAGQRGVMLHACGVKYRGKGIVFAGISGAGKSTTANLWKTKKDAVVLSDDRVIVRKINSQFYLYGTPWHGDALGFSAQRAPLEMIFFLKKAINNSTEVIAPVDAASRLIVHSFAPLWNKIGTEFTLDFCAELFQKVPAYELSFLPDESAVDFVRSKL